MQKKANIKLLPSQRTCIQAGHKAKIPEFICTFDKCSHNNRWVCVYCALEYIHKHGLETSEHIMEKEKFLEFIQQKEQHKYYNELLTSIEQFINELNKLSQTIIEYLKTETIRIKNENNVNFIEDSIKIIKEDFYILSNEQINKLVNMKQSLIYFDDQKFSKFMEQQNYLFQDFIVILQKATNKELQIQEKQSLQNSIFQQNNFVQESMQGQQIQNNSTILIDLIRCSNVFQQRLQQLKPQIKITSGSERLRQSDNCRQQQIPIIVGMSSIQKINQMQCISHQIPNNQQLKYNLAIQIKLTDKINTVFMTYDGQFLILGQNNGYTKIHDLLLDKIVKTMYIDNIVQICVCDNASNYLACADSKGFIQIYCLRDDFKHIYNKKIHNNKILNMKFINQSQLITCSDDRNIIITNFIVDKQIIQVESQQETYIQDIDYDDNEKIIISSCSKTINFFSIEDLTFFFNQQNAHDDVIYNIQLIPKDNCLMTSNLNMIKLWKIDYTNKQLINLEIFQFKNQSQNFLQIIHKANFVIVAEKIKDHDSNANQVQIIDENFWLYGFLNKFQITKYIFLQSDFKYNQDIQIYKQDEPSQIKH